MLLVNSFAIGVVLSEGNITIRLSAWSQSNHRQDININFNYRNQKK